MARHTIYFDEEMEQRCKKVFDVYDEEIRYELPFGHTLSSFLSTLVNQEYNKIFDNTSEVHK